MKSKFLVFKIFYGISKFRYSKKYVEINFFKWYLFPTLNSGDFLSPVCIDIYNPWKSIHLLANSIDEMSPYSIRIGWFEACYLRWFCFKLVFIRKCYNEELTAIYGKNYDLKKETVDGAIQKWNKFALTTYFND